jgi:drug/metabolite transporter (DMT)-like permease
MDAGDLLTLLCAIAFAGHLLALAHSSPRVSVPQLATLQISFAALIMGITLPLGGPLYLSMTPRLGVTLAVTGLLATAAAFTIQSWAQRHLPPTHTALLLTLEPVFAWLTSFFFLGERLRSRSLIGAFLILTGISITELFSSAAPISEHPL